MAFLLFPDGVNLISVDGEAQDQGQGEAEVKGSVSQKKAIATLKISGCPGERTVLGSGHRPVTEALAFQIYSGTLEEEFNHFEDWLNVFPLYRGQGGQDGDGEEEGSGHPVGKFKVCLGKEEWPRSTSGEAGERLSSQGLFCLPQIQGSFLIYPESEAVSFSEPQISRGVPQNRPIKLLVRVYVVNVSIHHPSTPPTPAKVTYIKTTD